VNRGAKNKIDGLLGLSTPPMFVRTLFWLADSRREPIESTTNARIYHNARDCTERINSTLVPRAPASRTRFATCPDLLVENPEAEIAPPAAQERI